MTGASAPSPLASGDVTMLDMSSPTFEADLHAALGTDTDEPGVTYEVITPQFVREDGFAYPDLIFDAVFWSGIEDRSLADLLALGLRQWGEGGLLLLPAHWYAHIPEGYPLFCIDGTTELFSAGKTDDDTRFGMLAYGIKHKDAA